MLVKYSLGIDISAEAFDANLSVIDSDQNVKVIASRKFDNTKTGFDDCDRMDHQALEATRRQVSYNYGGHRCVL